MPNKKQINAAELGIDAASKKESELFKWFLACLLFGKPIQQEIAQKAYVEITKAGINDLEKLLKTDWNTLVKLLDEAHYVRYDFSTAAKLLEVGNELKEKYGSVTKLIENSENRKALKEKLDAFKGVGPVTADIFLREVSDDWFKK